MVISTQKVNPTNQYKKAKADLFQAMHSIKSLPPQDRERLLLEVLGVEGVLSLLKLYRGYLIMLLYNSALPH